MNFWEALSAFLLSGIKLLFTPMGYAAVNVFPLIEIALICAAGGAFGGIIFFFVGKGLNKLGAKKTPTKKRKIFTKQNRKIIQIKNSFGLFGTAMTIGIISVPVGAILVGKYFGKNKLAIPTLLSASIIWSFAITYSTALVVKKIVPLF